MFINFSMVLDLVIGLESVMVSESVVLETILTETSLVPGLILCIAIAESVLFVGRTGFQRQLDQFDLVFGRVVRRWIHRWKYSLPKLRSVPAIS